MIQITETLVVDDREIDERFVRAAGPGRQNVNKVATAVQLRFDIGRSSLPPDVKDWLIALSVRQVTTDGVLMLDQYLRARREVPHDISLPLIGFGS